MIIGGIIGAPTANTGSEASVTATEAKVGGSDRGLNSSIQRYSSRGPILYRRASNTNSLKAALAGGIHFTDRLKTFYFFGARAKAPGNALHIKLRITDTRKYFVSEASAYRLLKAQDLIASPAFIVIKAANEFKDKTTAPNQLGQTDFTYLKVIGWGWFYLSTILDDFSRYIIAWKLCTTMKAEDVTETLELALKASGCENAQVVHRPRLLSDNGSCYVSADLAKWLDDRKMQHVRGAPYHPQTQGKIESWHQTLKNRILLENYYLPGDLEAQIGDFVACYNHLRYHESIANLTPADVYFGRGQTILLERERIKRQTIQNRRLNYRRIAA
jgi:putative transposase